MRPRDQEPRHAGHDEQRPEKRPLPIVSVGARGDQEHGAPS